MKSTIVKRSLLFILALAICCNPAAAQVFSTLHYFRGNDGASLEAGLILSSNALYGTAEDGGTHNGGVIFAINTDGTGFTNLYDFANGGYAGLILSGSTLYGPAGGGNFREGSIFAIHTDGSGFTNLYNFTAAATNDEGLFTNGDGAFANGLTLSGSTLYGTTYEGGPNGNGTVFVVGVDGTDFTNLYDFSAGDTNALGVYTNSDGANSYAVPVLSGDVLYGTTYNGGTNGFGTVFSLHVNGTDFTNLYNFTGGSDGANPQAGLVLSGNRLYGTARFGGTNNQGTVFAINTDGTNFTNLYVFNGNDGSSDPESSLILSGSTLYGTTFNGGTNDVGTVFAINTDGTDFTVLHEFNGYTDGTSPIAGVILSGNTLYGTTFEGATYPNWAGSVFALSLGPIPLNIQTDSQGQEITWGNPAFSLQTASALTGPWTTLSNAASPYVVVATNIQAFFQLVYTNGP
jgi:uncharacterized repeat protein (TIGR03803 family)